MTEENIDRDKSLIGGKESVNLELVDYDNSWSDKFKVESHKIKNALGDIVTLIEHIGSTSIPGLAAKPIIDIVVSIDNPENEEEYKDNLEGIGYELRVREPDFYEHRMFRTHKRDVHLHIFPSNCIEIDRYITFRNALRDSLSKREEYHTLKANLINQGITDMNEYASKKGEFIESVIRSSKN